MTDDLVPGTCATPEEFWYWLTGKHGITRPVHRVHPDYCLDGDDCGCIILRHEGRCPYSVEEYARIVEWRQMRSGRWRSVAMARARR